MKIFKMLSKIVISGMLAVIILSGYVAIFNNTGVHVKNLTNETDYKWESFQKKSVSNEGFAFFSMDENGFNNYYEPDVVDILLMGSSHMEAVNVEKNENAGYLLNSALKDKSVYNIGISGHNIYTCVKNMEAAIAKYKPSSYVILETSNIDMDINSMDMVINGDYPEIESYDTGIIYFVQKRIPVVKALYKSFTEWSVRDTKVNEESDSEINTNFNSENYVETLQKFLSKASANATASGAKLIILYHPRVELDNKGDITYCTNEIALEKFEDICRNNNIILVNMTSDYEKLYNDSHVLPYGFINTAIGVGHLNKHGHEAIANRLVEVMESNDDIK